MVEMKREQEKHKNFISSFLVIWRLWRLLAFGCSNQSFFPPFLVSKNLSPFRDCTVTHRLTRAPSSLEKKIILFTNSIALVEHTLEHVKEATRSRKTRKERKRESL